MHNRIISKTPPNAVLVVRPLRHMPLTAYIEVVDLMTQNTLDIFLRRQNFRIQFSSVQPTVQCAMPLQCRSRGLCCSTNGQIIGNKRRGLAYCWLVSFCSTVGVSQQ